jgi:hypothetical protein
VGIREQLNEHPGATTGITAAIVIAAIGFIIWQVIPHAPEAGKAYFSTDDGASYFADDASNLPPYDKAGKQAVRAYVYQCATGKPFVLYLEKYTDDGKKRMEQMANRPANTPPPAAVDPTSISLVKKPGTGTWIGMRDPNYAKVTEVRCPDGSTSATPVLP